MTIPVPIPSLPVTISDADTARAEGLLQEFIQIVARGTSGGTPALQTPASLVPDNPNPTSLVPLLLDSPEKQLLWRQLALAVTLKSARFASQTVIGITALSTDPAAPNSPVALNAEEVSVVPEGNAVPRARPDGTLDPGWISGSSGTGSGVPGTFTAVCDASILVGDLVYVSGPAPNVDKVDITDSTKIPVIGIVVSKPSDTDCVVQVHGIVENVYFSLTPNAFYFCDPAARPDTTRPAGSDVAPVFVIPIGYAIDAAKFLLRPTTIVKTKS